MHAALLGLDQVDLVHTSAVLAARRNYARGAAGRDPRFLPPRLVVGPTGARGRVLGGYARSVVGPYRRLQRLLRRFGLGPTAPSRKAPKPRAAAVVIDGNQVLVMKRHKRGRDYAVLPGGGVEQGETAAEAARRELHEETTLVAEIDRLLWTGRHNDRPASYFLMTAVRGRAELSGPEALANRPDNRFELHWITADQFADLSLHPPDIRGPLAELLARRHEPT